MWIRMVGNSRSELATGSLDGPSLTAGYCNGLRGSFSGASLERSGSFRETALNSVGAGNRTASPASPAEIPPPSHFLSLDLLSVGDQKFPRSTELRRAIGVSVEDHSLGAVQSRTQTPAAAEELKRFKFSVVETSSKARDRARLLQESITKLDRYRILVSKKRQRSDIPLSERAGAANIMKIGSQIHQSPSDIAAQRLEERTKNSVPNKRMRTSVAEVRADGRGNLPLRQGPTGDKEKNAPLDKDKNLLRACSGLISVEEKSRVHSGGEGWEKKMKRKRSGGPVVTRPVDGDRDFKSSAQQRLSLESRSRLNDSLTFRQGSSGVNGTMKSESSPQQNMPGSRLVSRGELDNASLSNDRKERSGMLEKERGPSKGGNKSNAREDGQLGSHSPLTKGKASRGPRTGPSSIMNSASSFQRSSIEGWDQNSCINKVPHFGTASNRKNSIPSISTSPPMAQWGTQRLPKNTRTRRTNLVPLVQNQEASALSEGVSSETRSFGNSQQLKAKESLVLSPSISESEESVAIENKFKDRVVYSSEMEDVDKVTSSSLLSKKNKPPNEEIGDGVRRPGRSGRGSSQLKSGAHLSKEKLENTDAARPMRIGRPGSDLSKGGRLPSKKLSERKGYGRPCFVLNSGSSEPIGEHDDDHNELLLAASSARNASNLSCSSSFWKDVEKVFSVTNEHASSSLKQQLKFLDEVEEGFSALADNGSNAANILSNPDGLDESNLVSSGKFDAEKWLCNIFPLSQRLLAAFIEEDDVGTIDYDMDMENDYTCRVMTGSAGFEAKYESELTGRSRKNGFIDNSCNGYNASSNFRSPEAQPVSYGNDLLQDIEIRGVRSEFGSEVSRSTFDFQNSQRCLDEKIMMELQNIGLLVDAVPGLEEGDDNELDRDLSALKGKLYEQMKTSKNRLSQLDVAIQKARQEDERRLEKTAMDKLVEMAYKRYLGGRGGHKSGLSKISKQAALSFAKRVLERCRRYDETGISCFREPPLRSALFSLPQPDPEVKPVDSQLPDVGPPSQPPSVSGATDPSGPAGPKSEPDPNSSRVKKREALLDDVAAPRTAPILGGPLPGGAKGKRSERERDQGPIRNPKTGRPIGPRAERKTKIKPRQKTSQLSDPPPRGANPEPVSRDPDPPMGFPNLPLESMDGLDVGVDLGGQGQDIGSWLNVDDDALLDNDLTMGLGIPMDDLSEINMNF
ncbi:uncharacterized protein LOC144716270 isoform X2 [Wolffia australiana]